MNFDNVILDGHHRFRAAKELSIKEIEVRIPELIDINEDEYLISIALNRRHLTEGQKAYLANEYRKVQSEKAVKRKLEIARAVKAGTPLNSMEDTSASKIEETERSRKLAANKFKVPERKVRTAQEIEKIAPEVYDMFMAGYTREDIAPVVNMDQSTITRDLKVLCNLENLPKFIKLFTSKQFASFEDPDFTPPLYNLRTYGKLTNG